MGGKMKCPQCGASNIEGDDVCENCGSDLTQDNLLEDKSKVGQFLLSEPLKNLKPRDAVYVEKDALVRIAIERMNLKKVGCALVEDDEGKLIGIITERDLLLRSDENLEQKKVGDIMSEKLETLNDNDNLASALK